MRGYKLEVLTKTTGDDDIPNWNYDEKLIFFYNLVPKMATRGCLVPKTITNGSQGNMGVCVWCPHENPRSLSCLKAKQFESSVQNIAKFIKICKKAYQKKGFHLFMD